MEYPKDIPENEKQLLERIRKRFPDCSTIDIEAFMFALQDIRLEAQEIARKEERLKWLGW